MATTSNAAMRKKTPFYGALFTTQTTRYHALPAEVRDLADKSFQLLKTDPSHPSLHFKKLGEVWSARVGLHYRAIAAEIDGDFLWVWIGAHGEYDKLRT